jgi:uncharacterized protein (DUF488 family)
VEIFTIGFTQKSAEAFFGTLKTSGVRQLVDVRLNNKSQLAGFAKRGDLEYFLRELCDATYSHEPLLAPTPDMLGAYRRKLMNWSDYERKYLELLDSRQVGAQIARRTFEIRTVLLCSELKADRCHRRLAAEYLASVWGDVSIVHL